MTKKEQRVLIAKDVIKQLRAGKFVASPGTYFDPSSSAEFRRVCDITDAQEAVRALKRCDVCARGAVLIAAVDRYNKLEGGYDALWSAAASGSHDGDREYINRFFAPRMLANMEAAFEWNPQWLKKYRSATQRLDAIMRNVISNGGDFDIASIPKPRKTPISKAVTR